MLYFVRHGQTEFNATNLYMGSLDLPLNELGIVQVETLAQRIFKLDLHLIVSSDLVRARQTADIINKALNVPIFISESLRERSLGSLEGKTKNQTIDIEKFHDIEDYFKFKDRVLKTIFTLGEISRCLNILIVSHSHVFKILTKCENLVLEKERLANCEYSSVRFVSST
mgnify:FL=1